MLFVFAGGFLIGLLCSPCKQSHQSPRNSLTQFSHISERDDRIILNVEVAMCSVSCDVDWNFAKTVRIARLEKHIRALVCEINDDELGLLHSLAPAFMASSQSTATEGRSQVQPPRRNRSAKWICVRRDAYGQKRSPTERIDDDERNERVTDRILEAIRKAEFVIVDLTNERPNVFFEAGYAHGLGKIPIYVAREGTHLHFDIQDYPVIIFRNMKELREGIAKRLMALITRSGLERLTE